MTYSDSGFVDVTSEDIATAIEALHEEQTLVSCRGRFQMTSDERARHDAFELWISAWIRQFSGMEPGRVHFARIDMHRLRGIIFAGFKARLARRYRMAAMSDDMAFIGKMKRMQAIEDFETRMWNPEPFSGSVICFERAVFLRSARRA